MSFLDEATQTQVREALADLEHDTELIVFTGSSLVVPGRDPAGEQRATLQLLREVAELSERIAVHERPIAADEEAARLELRYAPTTLLREAGSDRSNIRFIGFPGGYEFSTLIATLQMLGRGEPILGETARQRLAEVTTPVRIQTFVTPTCPYCPQAVLAGYKLAYHNPQVTAEGIEASEFPLLSQQYRISGVPDSIISGQSETRLLGAQPDRVFIDAVVNAAAPAAG